MRVLIIRNLVDSEERVLGIRNLVDSDERVQ